MNDTSDDFMRGAVEALLFISERPVAIEQILEALPGTTPTFIRNMIQDLRNEYEEKQRGMVILEIAGGFQMLSSPRYSDTIRTFFKTRVKERLSKPALETLAIMAYKQPVSRADVELIRGVNSDGVVLHLLNRGLIKVVGRKEVPGRPFLYGTTKQFLEYFGLKSLSDLPKLEDFATLFASATAEGAKGADAGAAIITVDGAIAAVPGEPISGEPTAIESLEGEVLEMASGSEESTNVEVPLSEEVTQIGGEPESEETELSKASQGLEQAADQKEMSYPSGASLAEEKIIDDIETSAGMIDENALPEQLAEGQETDDGALRKEKHNQEVVES